MLPPITPGASYDDIANIIIPTATERDNMICMVVFANLHPTIVASLFLTFQLSKQLIYRIGTRRLSLTRPTSMRVSARDLFTSLSLKILTGLLAIPFHIAPIPIARQFTLVLKVRESRGPLPLGNRFLTKRLRRSMRSNPTGITLFRCLLMICIILLIIGKPRIPMFFVIG